MSRCRGEGDLFDIKSVENFRTKFVTVLYLSFCDGLLYPFFPSTWSVCMLTVSTVWCHGLELWNKKTRNLSLFCKNVGRFRLSDAAAERTADCAHFRLFLLARNSLGVSLCFDCWNGPWWDQTKYIKSIGWWEAVRFCRHPASSQPRQRREAVADFSSVNH